MATQQFAIGIGTPQSQAQMGEWLGITVGQGLVPGNAADIKGDMINALNRAVFENAEILCVDFGTNEGVKADANLTPGGAVGYAALMLSFDDAVVPVQTIKDMIGNQSNITQTSGGQARPYEDVVNRCINLINACGTSIPAFLTVSAGLAFTDGFTVNLGFTP